MLSDVLLDAAQSVQQAVVEYDHVGYSEEDLEKVEALAAQLRVVALQLASLTEGADVEIDGLIDGEMDGESYVESEDDIV